MPTLPSLPTRRASYRQLGVFGALFSLLIVGLFAGSDTQQKLGLLFAGALISFLAVFGVEEVKRAVQVTDLARALHEELAAHAARCVFDFENPWGAWVEQPEEIEVLRLRKFVPAPPLIYRATASQIALLGDEAPRALILFYSRLTSYQTDMEDIANYYDKLGLQVESRHVKMIAGRLERTLLPALQALTALSKMVEGFEKIEAAAMAEPDRFFKHERAGQTLRQRLEYYCNEQKTPD